MSRLNIVVLAGGLGTRFSDKGYDIPKPLLPTKNGLPLYASVLTNFLYQYKGKVGKVILVTRREYNIFSPLFDNIIYQDEPTGALDSAYLGMKDLDKEEMVMVMNCDQLIQYNGENLDVLINKMRQSDMGILFHFESRENKWGYSKIEDGNIKDIKEKEPISKHAHTGHYLLNSVEKFIQFYKVVKQKDIKVNNEYFLSSVYSEFLETNKTIIWGNILPFHVEIMIPLGDPEDYEKNKDIIV